MTITTQIASSMMSIWEYEEGYRMPLACLVYTASLSPDTSDGDLHQFKDTNTRHHAKNRITGMMMIAGKQLFEIMEGEYAILEASLDAVSSSEFVEEPEVLLFSTLKKNQFQSWKMGVLEANEMGSNDLSTLKMLGEQALADPSSTPAAALQMLKQFHEQFAKKAEAA
ncbi:MAG: BLUF domain-containing protein [Phycisphaerales bacterium]|nr:BLUF domain-containing protein [Phycisphaerales bacterium]